MSNVPARLPFSSPPRTQKKPENEGMMLNSPFSLSKAKLEERDFLPAAVILHFPSHVTLQGGKRVACGSSLPSAKGSHGAEAAVDHSQLAILKKSLRERKNIALTLKLWDAELEEGITRLTAWCCTMVIKEITKVLFLNSCTSLFQQQNIFRWRFTSSSSYGAARRAC